MFYSHFFLLGYVIARVRTQYTASTMNHWGVYKAEISIWG